MSLRYKGGVISATPPTPTSSAATGVWTLEQQLQYQGSGTWPAPLNYIEDVFSTYLYDGTGATQTITNGIDLSGKGGLVWCKARSAAQVNVLTDTARGVNSQLFSNLALAAYSNTDNITSFNTNGFSLGNDVSGPNINGNGTIYTSWTFRKQTKFFDVVTYTGNGTARTISHNLGSTPGCIFVKCTSTSGSWAVYHRSIADPNTNGIILNLTDPAFSVGSAWWNSTAPTSTQFSLGTSSVVNTDGATYVAYLFAHDAGGFGTSGSDNVITCGSYTGDGLNPGPTITLNYEPQWFLVKNASNTGNWQIYDDVRGLTMASNNDWVLNPNLSDAESGSSRLIILPTGIQINTNSTELNTNGNTYIYIAIRRGPMKTPTDATKVFTPTVYTGTNVDNRLINTTIAPDFVMIRQRNDTVIPGMYTGARITGNQFLITGSTNAEAGDANSFDAQIVSAVEYGSAFASMSGVWVGNDATRKFNVNTTSNNHIIEAFKRAPGFFDVVCYTGNGANRTITHNLGVAPEMMWIKSRSAAGYNWAVYHSAIGNTKYLNLNLNGAENTSTSTWNSTTPTSSVFSLGTDLFVNADTETRIAFLFASCPGVSKVGSYTGNGTNQTINCGFTAGARFVLIKRTDSTGDWCVFDSARGIVANDDPFIQLNSTAAEVTNEDAVDTANSGFIVNQTTEALNTNSATYIYLAIA